MTSTTTTTNNNNNNNSNILIVCDVQPDVVNKLEKPRLFVDLINLVVAASRKATNHQKKPSRIIYTQLRFPDGNYDQYIPITHPRLGILRKLGSSGGTVKWFTSEDLCVANANNADDTSEDNDNGNNNTIEEMALSRTTYLPHANDTKLIEALKPGKGSSNLEQHTVTVIGYGPTVQSICHLLGDVLALPNVVLIQECIDDDNHKRCESFLDHGLLFRESVISIVDYLESLDLLHENIIETMPPPPPASNNNTNTTPPLTQPPPIKYVCDVGRGGHLTLFMPYLLQQGYVEWPIQPWYQERKSFIGENKQYYCPLGRCQVELCDEPQFCLGPRFFLLGRQYLDEKDLLYELVPELLPPTFQSLKDAEEYAAQEKEQTTTTTTTMLLWFLKKVNQNGGRAVDVLKAIPTKPLAQDEQLQVHIPRPLLWENKHKCHVKTYYYLSTCLTNYNNNNNQDNNAAAAVVEWHLYLHDLYYVATAEKPWNINDTSDECQITTLRTHRLLPDDPWRNKWNLSNLCEQHLNTVVSRAIQQGKLQVPPTAITSSDTNRIQTSSTTRTLQFEINSADWMLNEDGRIYLIECNGIPVLYDGNNQDPLLCTRGLKLYDQLYKENPKNAVVNDHELLKDAVSIAIKGIVPKASLWKRIATIPATKATATTLVAGPS